MPLNHRSPDDDRGTDILAQRARPDVVLVTLVCHAPVLILLLAPPMAWAIFEGARGLAITDAMRLGIALQACLPILNLGLEAYDGWVSVIVYPDEFVVEYEEEDEIAVDSPIVLVVVLVLGIYIDIEDEDENEYEHDFKCN